MKHLTKFVLLASLAFSVWLIEADREILIESRESKTASGGAVFNKIRWLRMRGRDVWMMNQSHHGATAGEPGWDRLAIVVDKTRTPLEARFYQLAPGRLEWSEGLPEKPFKVACFMCHNNGPRAIRPNDSSPLAPLSFRDNLQIAYWNLRIKLYGRVVPSVHHDERDKSQVPPFRFRGAYENESLKVPVCMRCHKESGFFSRGELRRQQAMTIQFLVESGQMPPLGFSLSSDEKRALQLFLEGL